MVVFRNSKNAVCVVSLQCPLFWEITIYPLRQHWPSGLGRGNVPDGTRRNDLRLPMLRKPLISGQSFLKNSAPHRLLNVATRAVVRMKFPCD